ncbi:MAG TPA: hypothetical protein VN231_03355 [Allosphingosinicella sp.]|nr:hypothetical protein [Allosphingosinicella sp.]
MPLRLALAAALLAFAAAAPAQDAPPPIEEVAADLAYGYCPLYLAGQFPLTGNPRLERFGFGGAVATAQHPRAGTIETVSAAHRDGEVAFGGAPGSLCNVTVGGPRGEAVLARLRRDMSLTGIQFAPDPGQSGERGGVAVESFKGRVAPRAMLHVQLLRMGGATPVVAVQLFATEE